jgi:hypothetical protein
MSQRKLILSMQITLDGYVAGPNDEADWLIISDDGWTDLNEDLEHRKKLVWIDSKPLKSGLIVLTYRPA